jgi:hypothetical protein
MRMVLAISALMFCFLVEAATPRDPAQVRAFKAHNPCPATGKIQKSCPGYIVDHKEPLCAGGADHPSNMQYLALAESLKKDKREVAYCACLKQHPRSSCHFTP